MNLSFVGAGYVGLVSAVGFSVKGQSVCCVDVDQRKVDMINQGIAPIYEKDLAPSMQNALQHNRLRATTSLQEAMDFADIIFIAVGTPSKADGSADMTFVDEALDGILSFLSRDIIIVNKSTVPVGTAARMRTKIDVYLEEHQIPYKVSIVSNPEFLREGQALHDFLYPDRVVLGGNDPGVLEDMVELYAAFVNDRSQVLCMDNSSAEMTKYAANAMLATRISFMNEISRICDVMGANIEEVRRGIGSDIRIGSFFLKAGIGYGGSCFPKDVDALICMGRSVGVEIPLITGTKETNSIQRNTFIQKILDCFPQRNGLTIAVWGLAFKPGTDDVRESPAISIIQSLFQAGFKSFTAYDREASGMAKKSLGAIPVVYGEDMYKILKNADALLICTEDSEFSNPDLKKVYELMHQKFIFDGRNILHPAKVHSEGFTYYSIGRPSQ